MPVDVRDPRTGVIYRVHSTNDPEEARARVQQELSRSTPQRGQARDIRTEITQGLQSINRGIPFAQDVSAGVNGIAEALQGRDFSQGVQAGRDYNSSLHEDFNARRPYASRFLEGTGNALPVALTLGATAPQQAAANTARGFNLWSQQTARGAATGGAWGAGYGGATGDVGNSSDINERLDAANQGAGLGAVFGGATPTVVNAAQATLQGLRPAWQGAERAARRLPVADPNSVGAMWRPMRQAPPPPPPNAPVLSGATRRRLPQLADRANMTADNVEAALGEARRNPQGQRLVDVFEDAGVRQLRPIVQAPGRTGQVAADALEQRAQAQPDILTGSLRRNLNVAETRSAAIRRLESDYQRVSAEQYNPMFEQPLSRPQRDALERAISTIRNVPQVRQAMTHADDLFAGDRELGLVTGQVDDNFARWSHYLKMSIDDIITRGRRDGSLAANQLRIANSARRQLLDAMDRNINGYGSARRNWAGIAEAEEALDEGALFLKMDAEEVGARMREMTPYQREHARIGLAHEVQQRIGLAGHADGSANVANIQALRSPEMRRRLAAVFETPEQAADFLGTASTQNRLMQNARMWGSGSQTQGNQAYEAEGVVQAVADAAGDTFTGNAGRVISRTGRQLGNLVTNNAVERSNNAYGGDLLRRIDDQESRAFTDEVIRILREREATRYANSSASQAAATIGGANQGNKPR